MNRATRLFEIMRDGKDHDTCELTARLGTGAFRAARELRKLLVHWELKTVRHEPHNEHQHAVYRLVPLTFEPIRLPRVQEPEKAVESNQASLPI